MPGLCSCLCPSLSVFFIHHGSSPVIHPGQATIPYKASGSPHLASYFHIRSVVTDRVYTGSGLECEAASPSPVPQTLLCSPPPERKPGQTSLSLTICSSSSFISPHLYFPSTHLPASFPCPSSFPRVSPSLLSSVGVVYFQPPLHQTHTLPSSLGSVAAKRACLGKETRRAQMVARSKFIA